MKESHAQQLLRLARELQEFQGDIAAGARVDHFAAPASREQALRMNLIAARKKTAVRMRWAVVAMAACLVFALSVRMMNSQSPTPTVASQGVSDQPKIDQAKIDQAKIDPTKVDQSMQSSGEAVSVATAAQTPAEMLNAGSNFEASKTTDAPPVHMVIALYRAESGPQVRCPECWCVAQWPANWGDGRTVNDLQEQELVADSMDRSCVIDARRIVVVGLSGPADSMPKNDQQALELSLCLIGEGATVGPLCVPSSLDYCMASWSK